MTTLTGIRRAMRVAEGKTRGTARHVYMAGSTYATLRREIDAMQFRGTTPTCCLDYVFGMQLHIEDFMAPGKVLCTKDPIQ